MGSGLARWMRALTLKGAYKYRRGRQVATAPLARANSGVNGWNDAQTNDDKPIRGSPGLLEC